MMELFFFSIKLHRGFVTIYGLYLFVFFLCGFERVIFGLIGFFFVVVVLLFEDLGF